MSPEAGQRGSQGPAGDGLVSVAAAAAVLIAMLAFLPVVQGLGWWVETVLFTVVVTAVAVGARRIGLVAPAAALLAIAAVPLLAALAVIGPAAAADPDAAAEASLAAVDGAFQQIYVDAVPAAGTAELALVMACGAALVAIIVDLVAVGLRAPLAGTLVILAVAIVPGKAFGTGTNGLLLVLVAAAALALVAADRRRRGAAPRIVGLAAGGAVAVVLALLAQVVLPAPLSTQASPLTAPAFGTAADPLLRLGQDLRRGATASVLSYTSRGSQPVYLRLAVLEDFRGRTWSPNPADGGPLAYSDAPAAPGLPEQAVRGVTTTTVVPAGPTAIGDRLPVPYPATEVTDLRGAGFRWETRGLTLARPGGGALGQYSVSSAVVDTAASTLRAASTSAPAGDDRSVALPSGMPAIIRSTAERWTRGAATQYDAALAIQNRLRDGSFAYDESTPAEQGYDGDGVGVIATFLRVKAGYCIHYASTMAVMARIQGIPSRIVVGYQPGTATPSGVRNVTSDDLHAWPELYFDGVGWVRFEPTPGRGSVPSYAPVPTTAPTATPTPTDSAAAVPTPVPTTAAPVSDGESAARATGVVGRVGATILAVAGVLALPGLVRALRRRRRLRRTAVGGARHAWDEVIDTATDLGLDSDPRGSPRTRAAALAEPMSGSRRSIDALDRLRDAYERESYSARPASADPRDVRLVLDRMELVVGGGRRFAAAVAPRSLVQRAGSGTLPSSRLAFRWSPPGSG